MSENNREGKRAARERLREQRERDKAREKRKRTAMVAGGIVAVLAIAAGVAIGLSSGGGSGGPVTGPRGATGKNGLALLAGRPDAPSTLTVYEDFRCPACDAFERTYRDTLHGLEDSGQLKVEYHLVTLIDGNLGGSGSLNAANAAACAQDAGKFLAYHDTLYDNQPEERDDRFSDTGYLDQLAGKVPGLRTAAFSSCASGGPYKAWVRKSNTDFNGSGYGSTPTVLLNGTSVYGNQANPLTPDRLKAMVAQANRGKAPGSAAPSPSGGSAAPGPSGSRPANSAASGHAAGATAPEHTASGRTVPGRASGHAPGRAAASTAPHHAGAVPPGISGTVPPTAYGRTTGGG